MDLPQQIRRACDADTQDGRDLRAGAARAILQHIPIDGAANWHPPRWTGQAIALAVAILDGDADRAETYWQATIIAGATHAYVLRTLATLEST